MMIKTFQQYRKLKPYDLPYSILQDLKNFLEKRNQQSMLKEEKLLPNGITDRTRKQLMYFLVLFLQEEYETINPKHDDVIEVSKATVELFPSLKDDMGTGSGIVSMLIIGCSFVNSFRIFFYISRSDSTTRPRRQVIYSTN